ncbi:GAF domain-containing protein [Trebonia kvetii]|uniref:histidine kinase n=1 Tax=Trebonia kvetii TaxID=2480626 RepID=A0A6P2BZC8_9ACTN|nr:GAF domain-containing protein [Trebonia kvetii]TVZ03551.1 GAF domain-containing protein [Trebonia kvetii]
MGAGPRDRIAEEQAALRRVAVLVAGGETPEEVFAAVTAEAGQLLDADIAAVGRYSSGSALTIVARWSATGDQRAGVHTRLGGRNAGTLVFETGRPVRMDDFSELSGQGGEVVRQLGIRSSVAVPISVEGLLWGVMIVSNTSDEPLPADAEARLVGFTELVGTAIANAQARVELRSFAEEQAALRRVAGLVAMGALPEEVFAAVAAEAGRLLGADLTAVGRYEPDGVVTVGAWSSSGTVMPFPAGSRTDLGGQNLITLVLQTGKPVRMDDYAGATGAGANVGHGWGFRAAVGVPITVEGRLWGVMAVGPTREERLPTDAEAHLVGFTELMGTAIANAQARVELRRYADEQAALRRVATLVASGAPSRELFAAVTEEIGRLMSAEFASISRYDENGMATAVGMWNAARIPLPVAEGDRFSLGGQNVTTLVFETGQPARMSDSASAGRIAEAAGRAGIQVAVGVPVRARGRLWGVVIVASADKASLPADTESRLVGFTELAGTAIANAEAQAALAASRARIVTAGDKARRRIERDLHDGAQQQLVTLALRLRETQADAPPAAAGLVTRLGEVADGLDSALEELRETARGIHPAALNAGGLRPALKALARRSAVRVDLRIQVPGRLPSPVEIAAYYVVSEALANAAKHANAAAVSAEIAVEDGVLRVTVRDDGQGGAAFGRGSGLLGLKDRVEALGGRITLQSSPNTGTILDAHLPVDG